MDWGTFAVAMASLLVGFGLSSVQQNRAWSRDDRVRRETQTREDRERLLDARRHAYTRYAGITTLINAVNEAIPSMDQIESLSDSYNEVLLIGPPVVRSAATELFNVTGKSDAGGQALTGDALTRKLLLAASALDGFRRAARVDLGVSAGESPDEK